MAAFVNLEHLVGTGYLYNGPKQICHARYRIDRYLEPSADIIGKSYLLDQLKEMSFPSRPARFALLLRIRFEQSVRNCLPEAPYYPCLPQRAQIEEIEQQAPIRPECRANLNE